MITEIKEIIMELRAYGHHQCACCGRKIGKDEEYFVSASSFALLCSDCMKNCYYDGKWKKMKEVE